MNDKSDIITELFSVEAMRGTTIDDDLFERLSATSEKYKPSLNKLIDVTTHGSPNLTAENLGF
jgi:hypothetical protein